jgi:four helix bundle protein
MDSPIFSPGKNVYSLTHQIRRTVSSVPANVAEGACRQTRRGSINYLHMAQGSLSELDTHLELAPRLGYIAQDTWVTIDRQIERTNKTPTGLIRHQKTAKT